MTTDTSTLYSTIALILPVFVLALAVNNFRLNELNPEHPEMEALFATTLLFAAAAGEIACFVALDGHATHFTRQVALFSLGFCGADLVTVLATRSIVRIPSKRNQQLLVLAFFSPVALYIATVVSRYL